MSSKDMKSSYHSLPQEADESYDRSFDRYQDNESPEVSNYGYHYSNYRPPPPSGLKGKVESKYWHTKQAVIEKLGKEQDVFVVAGDSEVDTRLQAFKHIQKTCIDLLKAIEVYQNRIFALSQDENEMGRFLREQGSQDKSKAGKMMIAVGKSQSYTAQQRLSLRTPLVRLYQEIETFRYRAISDTLMTISRMENSRTEYRANLLWMADISKELDPEEWKRLDKFREVQCKVKTFKKKFEKNKHDVMQKVDLLSASRCNLLSSTLAAYQQAMLKFWENTSKNMNQVAEQFKGYPTYQFQMLKSLNPMMDPEEKGSDETKEIKGVEETNDEKKKRRSLEEATEQTEEHINAENDDDDDTLICLDNSPTAESQTRKDDDDDDALLETDLLGDISERKVTSEGLDDVTPPHFDLLGADEKVPARQGNIGGDLLGTLDEINSSRDPPSYEAAKDLLSLEGSYQSSEGVNDGRIRDVQTSSSMTADDLLFGSPSRGLGGNKSDLDLLGDVFSDSPSSQADVNSFSSKWNELFGDSTKPQVPINNADSKYPGYLPSDLMDSLAGMDPFGDPPNKGLARPYLQRENLPFTRNPSNGTSKQPAFKANLGGILGGKSGKEKSKTSGGDQSAWFSLFSDLDPLANPDAIGQGKKKEDERSC